MNKLIDRLPVELHIPGYEFCGPGTKLSKRLERGDEVVNYLLKIQRYRNNFAKSKNGGFLPLLFPLLGVLGGDVAGIAKAGNDAKADKQKLEEKRHNAAVEVVMKGKG